MKHTFSRQEFAAFAPGHTAKEIAKRFRLHLNSVYYRLHKYGLDFVQAKRGPKQPYLSEFLAFAPGKTIKEIAEKFGVARHYVYELCHANGVAFKSCKAIIDQEKYKRIHAWACEGRTFREIGGDLGISKERVRQKILKAIGLFGPVERQWKTATEAAALLGISHEKLAACLRSMGKPLDGRRSKLYPEDMAAVKAFMEESCRKCPVCGTPTNSRGLACPAHSSKILPMAENTQKGSFIHLVTQAVLPPGQAAMLTAEEARLRIGCSLPLIYQLIRYGLLPTVPGRFHVRWGNCRLIHASHAEFLAGLWEKVKESKAGSNDSV